MQYVHLALALHSAGKPVTADSIKKMCTAAGVTPDDGKIKALVASLEGVDIDAKIKEAPIGVAAAAPATSSGAAPAAAAAKEEPKEEEPAGDDMGLDSLFG